MGAVQDTSNLGAAAFRAKYNDVSKRIKDLHVEVEMFRVLADEQYLLDKAATLAEVEQYVKAALTALRESDERRVADQSSETAAGDLSRTTTSN
jgi:hypothetical protein